MTYQQIIDRSAQLIAELRELQAAAAMRRAANQEANVPVRARGDVQ